VDGTGSVSCPVAIFGTRINSVRTFGISYNILVTNVEMMW
jgi:hypothetical protein